MALLAGCAAAAGVPVDRLRVPAGFRIELLTDAVPNARALALGRFEGDRGVVYVGSRSGAVYAVEIERGRTRAVRTDRLRIEPAGRRRVAGRRLYVSAYRASCASTTSSAPRHPPRAGRRHRRIPDRRPPRLEVHRLRSRRQALRAGRRALQRLRGPAPRASSDERGRHQARDSAGIRNTSASTGTRSTKELWFTENGRDMLGDDVPPDELNHAPSAGLDFGFPCCHGMETSPTPVRHARALRRDRAAGRRAGRARRGARHALLHGRACSPRGTATRSSSPSTAPGTAAAKMGYRVTVELDVRGEGPSHEAFATAGSRRRRQPERLGPARRRAGRGRTGRCSSRTTRRGRDLPHRLPRTGELRAEQVLPASATVPAYIVGDRV